jgi:thiol-disulfide isomerase/thioredoxin
MNKAALPLTGLEFIKGEPLDLATLRGKNVVVVELWATWCPPCRTSIPHLTEVQKKFANQGLLVVGITNEEREQAEPFVKKMGGQMDYRVACDSSGTVTQQYMAAVRARGIPTAIVINAKGNIAWHGHPMDPQFESVIANALTEIKSSSSSSSADSSDDPQVGQVEQDIKKAQSVLNGSPNYDLAPLEASLSSLAPRSLKAILQNHGFDSADCVEKADLVHKIMRRVVRLESS